MDEVQRDYIWITSNDVKDAMRKVGTKKAPAADGMLDIIFQQKE